MKTSIGEEAEVFIHELCMMRTENENRVLRLVLNILLFDPTMPLLTAHLSSKHFDLESGSFIFSLNIRFHCAV